VGDKVKREELITLASEPSNVYFSRNFDSIVNIKKSLLGRICSQVTTDQLKGCDDVELDLQFILDGSTSVNLHHKGNFKAAQDFIKNVSATFDLRTGGVRLGVLTYSTDVHEQRKIPLGSIHSQDDFNAKVDALPYDGGDTHTGAALRYIDQNIHWREDSDIPKVIIFITDGTPQDIRKVPAAAKALRDKKVRIFAIGVGVATREELEQIASKPYDDHVIFIEGANYQATTNIRATLERMVCHEAVAISQGYDPDQGLPASIRLTTVIQNPGN
jgi:uncharacterized protein YegL